MKFQATIKGDKLSIYQSEQFRQYCKENDGQRLLIVPITPESKEQRKYFEGAIIPLITYYQEGMNHRSSADCEKVREFLKVEFNGEIVKVGDKVHLVAQSTKGKLQDGFLERVMDWLIENYAPPTEAVLPDSYKKWRDELRDDLPDPEGADYISYLISKKILS